MKTCNYCESRNTIQGHNMNPRVITSRCLDCGFIETQFPGRAQETTIRVTQWFIIIAMTILILGDLFNVLLVQWGLVMLSALSLYATTVLITVIWAKISEKGRNERI